MITNHILIFLQLLKVANISITQIIIATTRNYHIKWKTDKIIVILKPYRPPTELFLCRL